MTIVLTLTVAASIDCACRIAATGIEVKGAAGLGFGAGGAVAGGGAAAVGGGGGGGAVNIITKENE